MTHTKHPYQNSALPINERVENLLSLMTLEEKIAQIGSYWVYELLDGQTLNADCAQRRADSALLQSQTVGGAFIPLRPLCRCQQ